MTSQRSVPGRVYSAKNTMYTTTSFGGNSLILLQDRIENRLFRISQKFDFNIFFLGCVSTSCWKWNFDFDWSYDWKSFLQVQLILLKILYLRVQWRFEYRPFEYRKHLNTELFEVQISNGLVFLWSVYVLCQMYQTDHSHTGPEHKKTRWRPCVWYSNRWAVWYSNGIWIPDHLASNLLLTIQIPNWFGIPICYIYKYPSNLLCVISFTLKG